MSTTPQSADQGAVIHTTADLALQAVTAAKFLDSHGVTARSLHVTELGRVECAVDGAGFQRAGMDLVLHYAGTRHREGDFLYIEGRVEGVPVQVWTSVDERNAFVSAEVEASYARAAAARRRDSFYRAGGAS